MKFPSLVCLISNPRKNFNSPIKDILNLEVMRAANSSLKALSGEPKIISSTYSWHTNNSPLTFLVKRVGSPNFKPTILQQLGKVVIPCTWGLFKAIECLIELVHMIGELGILKPRGLFDIHHLINRTI